MSDSVTESKTMPKQQPESLLAGNELPKWTMPKKGDRYRRIRYVKCSNGTTRELSILMEFDGETWKCVSGVILS